MQDVPSLVVGGGPFHSLWFSKMVKRTGKELCRAFRSEDSLKGGEFQCDRLYVTDISGQKSFSLQGRDFFLSFWAGEVGKDDDLGGCGYFQKLTREKILAGLWLVFSAGNEALRRRHSECGRSEQFVILLLTVQKIQDKNS